MSDWNAKLDAIRSAIETAMHGLDNARQLVGVYFEGEDIGGGDPLVLLELDNFEEAYRDDTPTVNGDGTLALGMSVCEQITMTVKVETIDFQGVPSALNLASKLRQRLFEQAVQSTLLADDIKMYGLPGNVMSRPYKDLEGRRIHSYIFEVKLRAETSEADPDSLNVFETLVVSGTLQPGDIETGDITVTEP